jgi:hypothetical protein
MTVRNNRREFIQPFARQKRKGKEAEVTAGSARPFSLVALQNLDIPILIHKPQFASTAAYLAC